MAGKADVTPRALDVAARSIDLLAELTKVSQAYGLGTTILKEVSKWLGREGLDENELRFFLESTYSLVRPNDQAEIVRFFNAVTERKAKKSVVPLSALPSGALGRIISADPYQKWITSTISCLFRYHDERFIKHVLCSFILLSANKGSEPLSEYQLAWHPDTLRLGEVANKVVHSNWLHIANAGIIGTPSECPHLPDELDWACEAGHNINSYQLALLASKLLDPPPEAIIQSDRLLTNLVLWLIWHFPGHLRIVVNGKVVYNKTLGLNGITVECRVSKFCKKDHKCTSADGESEFQMLEKVPGGLKMLFSGKYDSQQTLSSGPSARQRLYRSPFRYPAGAQRSIKIQVERTAQELLRWFVDRPVTEFPFDRDLQYRVSLASDSESPCNLRVGDLLGRTPRLLNMDCGELGRPFVVFSMPSQLSIPSIDESLDDESSAEVGSSDSSASVSQAQEILKFLPIMYDLVVSVSRSCRCSTCKDKSLPNFGFDDGCEAYKAFLEALLYFAHGIADALGASDASSYDEDRAHDTNAINVLLDLIQSVRHGSRNLEGGLLSWNMLLFTSAEVFLGCSATDDFGSPFTIDPMMSTSPNLKQHHRSTVVAIQYGDLALVVPWLDITQQLSARGSLRFTVAEGRLGVPIGEESGQLQYQSLARDKVILETQHTEDVNNDMELAELATHTAGSKIEVPEDRCEALCAYFLVSVDEHRYKLLMRVSSGLYSRMVDPSMSLLRIAEGAPRIKCEHEDKAHGVVPKDHIVELFDFDSILGLAAEASAEASMAGDDLSEWSVTLSEDEAHPWISRAARSDAAGQSEQQQLTTPAIRVSHVLNSHFKVNTAIALSCNGEILVNPGTGCLTCTLETAAGLSWTDARGKKHCRWVIQATRDPTRQVPRLRHQLTGSRKPALLKDAGQAKRLKRKTTSGPAHDAMEMDDSNLAACLRRACQLVEELGSLSHLRCPTTCPSVAPFFPSICFP